MSEARMLEASAADTVRRYFALLQSQDCAAMVAAMTEEFRFSSPLDDSIDKHAFFERYWPHAAEIQSFELELVVARGEQVFVRYIATRAADGTRFRNTEIITLRDGRIDCVDVYFGRDLDVRHGNGEEAVVRKRWEERATAMREKDAGALAALYEPYACTFDLSPPLASAVSPVDRRRELALWFETKEGPLEIETRNLEVCVHGELAVAHALQRMASTEKNGDRSDLWLRNTTVYQKIEGHWVIAHEHSSVPVDADTFLACRDLEP